MPAASQILRFCQNDTGTNIQTQGAYAADSQRLNGNQPGTARATFVNKVLRQTALMSSGVANWIARWQDTDVVDTLTDANLGDMMDAAFNAAFTSRLAAAQVVLPGSMMMWPNNSIPAGWLKRNGAAISRTTYAALFAQLGTTYGPGDGSTTFNLPDDRGLFERGWDDARGIDTGRVLGSQQSGQNQSHTHTGTADSAGNHSHTNYEMSTISGNSFGITVSSNSPQSGPGGSTVPSAITAAGIHTHNLTINGSGGTEARPINRAYVPIIKF